MQDCRLSVGVEAFGAAWMPATSAGMTAARVEATHDGKL
jgi:hypothetical protein